MLELLGWDGIECEGKGGPTAGGFDDLSPLLGGDFKGCHFDGVCGCFVL